MGMQNRDPHNTSTLQKHFTDTYRSFFSKCQKVASAPNSFLWAGEFSGFYEDGLLISQKLPFRVYVGIESTLDGKIEVEQEYTTYDVEEDAFTKRVFDTQLSNQFKLFLENYFKDKLEIGFKIHVLTEAPMGHGLGSNGALAAALATLIADDLPFEKQYELAYSILSGSQKGYSSGVTAYNALVSTDQPILFYGHKKKHKAYPISEIAKVKSPLTWPIDFGLIYTGVQTNSENVVLAAEHTMTELNDASQSVNELIKNYSHPPFQQTFLDMLNMTSALMVNGFARIFNRGANDASLQEFFGTLNQYQNLLHILNISTKTSDIIYRHLHELANKEVNGSGSGVKVSGIGKGGVMLFAVPYGAHRTEVSLLIDELREKFNKNIRLDYASWLDGIGEGGARVEQDISKNIVSNLLSEDVVLAKILHHGKEVRQTMTLERYQDLAFKSELVVDKTSGKIYIAGKPLTSKELPSQKATAIILYDLLNSSNYKLSNEQISDSYGSNRYDLHSKIVLPIVKQLMKMANKDFQLSVSGGMYDQFELRLDPSNVSILILEKKL